MCTDDRCAGPRSVSSTGAPEAEQPHKAVKSSRAKRPRRTMKRLYPSDEEVVLTVVLNCVLVT